MYKTLFKLSLLLFSSVILTQCSKSTTKDTDEEKEENIVFASKYGTFSGVGLPYREAKIAQNIATTSALVIYLHGGSSKGNDNTTQMNEPAISTIKDYLVKNKINSVLVVPQCASNLSWGGKMNPVLKGLIDQYILSGTINADKIYILGGSMGGTGTWSMLSSYPNVFAAAMPVAGNPSATLVSNVATTPVYTVMGTADEIMSIPTVETYIQNLKNNGGTAVFDTENGWTHGDTCIKSYTDSRLYWVFSKTKK